MPAIEPDSGRSGPAAAVLFGSLSRLRRRRIAHPHGIGFDAELSIDLPPSQDQAAGVFAKRATQRAVVRFSRALGLPETVPDILGIAVRLSDCYGPGVHQDLLTVTSWRAPLARHTLIPAPRGFLGHFFTTLVPYRVGERLLMVGFEANSPLTIAASPRPLCCAGIRIRIRVARGGDGKTLGARRRSANRPADRRRRDRQGPLQPLEHRAGTDARRSATEDAGRCLCGEPAGLGSMKPRRLRRLRERSEEA